MKAGTENRKKLILASSLGVVALGAVLYTLAGGSSDAPAPTPVPAPVAIARQTPSPAATRASFSASDPTLHPEGMELTERLVYTGNGRNIFAINAAAPARIFIPAAIAPARSFVAPIAAAVDPGPPPIDLRFFGTATHGNGSRQAFFLRGEDVFLAQEGDVVGRRYKVGAIAATSVEITDLTNDNRQRLPLAMQ